MDTPITQQPLTPKPTWLQSPQMQALHQAVKAEKGHIKIVGGVVRDLLRNTQATHTWPNDIDMATSLLPDTMLHIAQTLGLKAIPTGIAHGTITLLMPQGPVEITSLREDIACDGRHATVQFGQSFLHDAQRRDFTLNALYLTFDGMVEDYLGQGIEDAKKGLVRFIGNAHTRIKEDALRMLRFYRFIAQTQSNEIDRISHQACCDLAETMQGLSVERVQKELLKLLAQQTPHRALNALQETQLLRFYMPNPWALESAYLNQLPAHAPQTLPIFRLALLLRTQPATTLGTIAETLRLSNKHKQYLTQLAPQHFPDLSANEAEHLAYLRQHGTGLYLDGLHVRAAYENTAWDAANICHLRTIAKTWEAPIFPVKAADLMAVGFTQGKALGETLRQIEGIWEDSQYQLSKEELLAHTKR